jgi:hypothetical protein
VKLRLTPQSVNTPQAPQPDTRGEFERMLDDPYPGCYGLAPADFDGLARKLMAEGRPLPRYLVEMLVKREPRSNN